MPRPAFEVLTGEQMHELAEEYAPLIVQRIEFGRERLFTPAQRERQLQYVHDELLDTLENLRIEEGGGNGD